MRVGRAGAHQQLEPGEMFDQFGNLQNSECSDEVHHSDQGLLRNFFFPLLFHEQHQNHKTSIIFNMYRYHVC